MDGRFETIGFLLVLIMAYLFLCLKLFLDSKRKEKDFLKKAEEQWGKIPSRDYSYEEFDIIKHYYLNSIKEDFVIDDITWNDLDMDNVFKLINTTYSSAGQEYLYDMLRRPSFDKKVLDERQSLIEFFSKSEEERKILQLNCAKLGRTKKLSITDYLNSLLELKQESNFKYYIANFFVVLGIGSLLIKPEIGVFMLIASLVYSGITHYTKKPVIAPYLQSFEYILKLLKSSEAIIKETRLNTNELYAYMEKLKEAQLHTQKFRKNSFLIMSGNNLTGAGPETWILEYVKIITHIDLIKFNNMLNEVRKNLSWIQETLEIFGFLESMIAIASFRESLSYYCVPELVEDNNLHLSAVQLYHPLISEPVSNDIQINSGVLITGSNASGKSTFLKTVAINQIISQTIMTSTSRNYKACYFKVYSSMALKDSLENSESYFIVEIKSLKRIIDSPKDKPILCFVDEVLRGTNTVERIAASAQILKSLATDNKILCFAATHDIELTHLLELYLENYHFEEKIVENDILFDYRLLKNKATTRNAIQLLRIIGYDDKIVSEAEKTAQKFLEFGEWKLTTSEMEA